MPPIFLRSLVVTAVLASNALAAAASNDATPAFPSNIRVVDCGQKVQSHKRGICVNKLSPADFAALAQGVSWYYNWDCKPGAAVALPDGIPMEYIPMVWGDGSSALKGISNYLAEGHRPRAVLCINEPNLSGQALMPPERAARAYAHVKAITDNYGIPLVGPHMSIGSPPNMSVKAFDPLENAEVTYTSMIPYLKAFFYYANRDGVEVAALGMHPYMAAGGIGGLMDQTFDTFQRPIWVTEYANSEEPRDDMHAKLRDLMQATDYLERSPGIVAYSYFKERNSVYPKLGLFEKESGKLNMLGEAYVNMPVHDADLYYRIPGRLQAENYATMSYMTIVPTTDVDGFAHMKTERPGATATYNIYTNRAAVYRLSFRVTGAPGKISVTRGDDVLASIKVEPAPHQWQTFETTVSLPEGAQTLGIQCEADFQGINWIEFSQAE